eukprot:CAMPEP_0167778458 /NCGR_PEP_ID=MMETSP0111_2-20121227/4264_1 /TAXON_ID=91324 /ORGANISM="Lotharella globosa, Strain CCCM811" /LENGTH=532 /DNA_ID=CAMNT_0007668763 /DNA_START=55 /DNA_END=1653 /DNA_ORIENTATION=+
MTADTPIQWLWAGRADPKESIELIFAVKQSHTDVLEKFVLTTSDPDSPMYGDHLSWEAVNKLVAPSWSSVLSVREYLAAHHVEHCEESPSSDFFHCLVTVAKAEKILDTEYHRFYHADNPHMTVLRTYFYSLPASVSSHIDFVAPTVRFPTVQRRRAPPSPKRKSNRTERRRENTPSTLRALYHIGDAEGKLGKQACTAFLEQYYEKSDLDLFWRRYYPKALGREIDVVGPDKRRGGVEANLDVQFLSTMGGGVPMEFWSFAGRAPDNPENEPFLKWMYLVGNTSDKVIPKVFSTSYGEAEHTVSMAYMNRINIEFKKAAARGISLLFATGDYGVTDEGSCTKGRFQGQWPAGSPWVTAVGGTEGGDVDVAEHAWPGSAGGFSDVWARPEYQKPFVDGYFETTKKSLLPKPKYYNQTGCGFPDVAAQANDFLVINDDELIGVAGTSCACPTFSGIVALLNDLRLAANKTTLGFLNPLFYKHPEVFMDITEGFNEAAASCGGLGFSASKGWDPVTGLGTPHYQKLKVLVESLD